MRQEKADQYMFALLFFSRVLQTPPDETLLRRIVEDGLFETFAAWDCFRPTETDGRGCLADPVRALRELRAACSPPPSPECGEPFYRSLHKELCKDHRALFSGPAPLARPWESVWKKRLGAPNDAQTEKLRQWYQDWGVNTKSTGPGDHLGLELAFTLRLLQAMVETPDAVSSWEQRPRAALADFMDQHIMRWAALCLSKASEEASTVFFRELPKLCCVMLENLRRDLANDK